MSSGNVSALNISSSGGNETLVQALFLMSVVPLLNSTFKLPKYVKEKSKEGPKYSDTNLKNLEAYFESLKSEDKKGPEGSKVPASFDNNSEDEEYEDGARIRSTTRKARPTRTARSTSRGTRRTTTASPTLPMTTEASEGSTLNPVDATWILICGMLIFTMQTGFGLLEGGIVAQKNETNIMLKNVADVVFGGFTYWMFGYGITFGTWPGSMSFFGFGYYFVDESYPAMGDLFTSFFFQLSFATTATTIVSGAMAERVNFKAYCLYSLLATVTYCVPARWVWGPGGFLAELGAVDVAGSGCVHLVGGTAAFVAAWMLGPRLGRYDTETGAPPMGNHNNALIGFFLLWWGWIAFNAGSTYGMTGNKWQYASRAASTTMIASIGGGLVGMLWGFLRGWRYGKIFEAVDIINSVLGALVGITAGCALMHMVEAFFTGVIGAIVVLLAGNLPDLLKIDDPVGATGVHGFGGMWGLLAVGVFAEDDYGILGLTKGRFGLVRAGGWYLLGIQTLTAVCIIAWSLVTTFIILMGINLMVPLRVTAQEELVGLDFAEHGVRRAKIGQSPALSLFGSTHEVHEISKHRTGVTGQDNPGHEKITEVLRDVRTKPRRKRSSGLRKKKFKTAATFIKAFHKIQKGNKITPRDRQYIFDEYSSPLKSSTESLNNNEDKGRNNNNQRNAGVQTENINNNKRHPSPARPFRTVIIEDAGDNHPEHTPRNKSSFWGRMNPLRGKSITTQTEEMGNKKESANNNNYYRVEETVTRVKKQTGAGNRDRSWRPVSSGRGYRESRKHFSDELGYLP